MLKCFMIEILKLELFKLIINYIILFFEILMIGV